MFYVLDIGELEFVSPYHHQSEEQLQIISNKRNQNQQPHLTALQQKNRNLPLLPRGGLNELLPTLVKPRKYPL